VSFTASTTSSTVSNLLLKILSLRTFQITHNTACHITAKPFFLFLAFELPKKDAKDMNRFGGLTRTNPNQHDTLYQTAEARLQWSRRWTGVSFAAPQKLHPVTPPTRSNPRLNRTRSAYQMMTLNLIQMMVPSVYSNFHKTMHIVMLLTTPIWYVCSKDVLAKCFLEHKMSIQSFNKNSLFTWKQTLDDPLLSNNLLS
jgi:hypothetical protein